MAEFTEFNAPIGVAGPTSTRRATAEDFGGSAKGLIQGGKDLQQLGKVLEAHQIKRENADINQSNIDNQGYGADLFREAKKHADANATDFTTSVLDEYDRNMEVQLANASNDRVRAEMKVSFTRTRNTLVESANLYEAVTRGKNEINVLAANGDTADNIVRANPTEQQYQDTLAGRIKEINNTSAADHIKEELVRDEVKSLRLQQFSGLLDAAVTAGEVDEILAQRPEDELSTEGFAQLGKTGLAKKRRFKVDARLLAVEHRQDVYAAQAAIRVENEQWSHGRPPDPATAAHTDSLVNQVNDPVTNEMRFVVRTVGEEVAGWLKLPSEDLKVIEAQLVEDAATDGATPLEGALLDAARTVLRKTLTGERAEQAEIDKSVSDLWGTMNDRIKAGQNLDDDPAYLAMRVLLHDASPNIQQTINEAVAHGALVDSLMGKSKAELEDLRREAEARSHLSDVDFVRLDAIRGVQSAMNKVINKNYVDWIQHADPDLFPPLNEDDPASMKRRETLMADGAAKYGKDPQFHTTRELTAIGDRIPEMTSDEQMAFIHGYTANMSRETALIALTELAAVNPMFAFVGAGIAHDLDYALVGTQILRGRKLLDAEGSNRILHTTKDSQSAAEAEIVEALGGGLLNEELPSTYRVAVQAAAMALLAEGTVTDAIVALNRVLGGTDDGLGGVQVFNGKSFVAPVGVSGDMMGDIFEDNSNSLTALSVDGSPPRLPTGEVISGETIRDAGTFEYVGPNMYVVRMTTDGRLLEGAPGTPYTVHINKERLLAVPEPDADTSMFVRGRYGTGGP